MRVNSVCLVVAAFLLANECAGEVKEHVNEHQKDATHWTPYSESYAEACEEKKPPYFVWVHPEASFFSEPIAKQLSRKYLNALTATTNYQCYILRFESWNNPLVKKIWKDAGHTKHPFLAFYHGGRIQAAFYVTSDISGPLEWKVKVYVEDGSDDDP